MDITVIVISYNEEANIAQCLQSLTAQQYSKGRFEIIVVDGQSQDQTPAIVKTFTQQYPFIRLMNNPGRTVSSNRNVGIRHAQYSFVAFTDADCVCPPHWLEKLSNGYDDCVRKGIRVGAIGGGNISDDQFGSISSAVGIAFDTPFSALGSQQTRVWKHDKEVESLAGLNVMYVKSIFDEIGMFDETQTNTAEDWIFNYHVREHGFRLVYIPDATILHKMRTTLPGFVKQMFRYGLGRGTVIRRNPKTMTWRYAAPVLFLIMMLLSLPLYGASRQILFLLPLLYYPLLLFYSVFLGASKKKIRLIPLIFTIFVIIHFVYSIGECIGLLRRKSKHAA